MDMLEGVGNEARPVCLGCLRDVDGPVSNAAEIVTSTRVFVAQARESGRKVVEFVMDSRADGGGLTTHILDLGDLERTNEAFAQKNRVE